MAPESKLPKQAQDLVRQTEEYVRTNPLPALLGAVAVGIAIGMVARALEREREPQPLQDALNEIKALLKPIAKKTQKAYAESSDAVREVVEQALDKAKEIDVDPVAGWWKRLWS